MLQYNYKQIAFQNESDVFKQVHQTGIIGWPFENSQKEKKHYLSRPNNYAWLLTDFKLPHVAYRC